MDAGAEALFLLLPQLQNAYVIREVMWDFMVLTFDALYVQLCDLIKPRCLELIKIYIWRGREVDERDVAGMFVLRDQAVLITTFWVEVSSPGHGTALDLRHFTQSFAQHPA